MRLWTYALALLLSLCATPQTSEAAPGTWTATAALEHRMDSPAAVAHNGMIYVLGGRPFFGGSGYTGSAVYLGITRQDGTIASWQQTATFTTGRYLHSAALDPATGTVYVIGGRGLDGTGLADVQYARILPGGGLTVFRTTTPLPDPRQAHTSVVHNGRVYVFKGESPRGSHVLLFSDIQLDGSLGPWNEAFPGGVAYGFMTSAIWEGRFFSFGGFSGFGGATAEVRRVDIPASGWPWSGTTVAPLPAPRALAGAAASDGVLYVTGGTLDYQPLASMYYAAVQSDGSLGAWQTGPNLPEGRSAHACVATNGYLYVIAGENDGGRTSDPVYFTPISSVHLDPTAVPTQGTPALWLQTTGLETKLQHAAAAASGGRIYVAGGQVLASGSGYTGAAVYLARTYQNGTIPAWEQTGVLPSGRHLHSVALDEGTSTLYVIGGRPNAGGADLSEVLYARVLQGGGLSTFASTTPLPDARHSHVSAVVAGHVYVWKGQSPRGSHVLLYSRIQPDGTLGPWSETVAAGSAFDLMTSARIGDSLYALGGRLPSSLAAADQVIRTRIGGSGVPLTGATATPLPRALFVASAATFAGNLYVTGGRSGTNTPLPGVLWTNVLPDGSVGFWRYANDLPEGREGHVAVATNGYLYVIAGSNLGGRVSDPVYVSEISPTHADAFVGTAATFPDGTVGQAYSRTLAVTGGLNPVTWTVESLPPGVVATPSGRNLTLSGSPSAAGQHETVVRATDGSGSVVRFSRSVSITGPMSISNAVVPQGFVGYDLGNWQLLVSGGTDPITWDAATPPPGVAVGPNGRSFLFGGVPTASGTFAWTVTARDATGATVSRTLNIVVGGPTPIPPTPQAGVPLISSVTPNPVSGSPTKQPFTITGTNFQDDSIVTLRDLTVGDTFSTPTVLVTSRSSTQIVLNAGFDTYTSSWTVEVANPGKGSSPPFAFQVLATDNRAPTHSANANQFRHPAGTAIPLNGGLVPSGTDVVFKVTGFDADGDQMRMEVELRKLPGGFIRAPTHSSDYAAPGTLLVTTPATGLEPGQYAWKYRVIDRRGAATDWSSAGNPDFVVQPPVGTTPTITSVSPNPVPGFNGKRQFTINGTNFHADATVTLRELDHGLVYERRTVSLPRSASQLTLTPNFTESAARWSVQVINPGGVTSAEFPFSVVAANTSRPERITREYAVDIPLEPTSLKVRDGCKLTVGAATNNRLVVVEEFRDAAGTITISGEVILGTSSVPQYLFASQRTTRDADGMRLELTAVHRDSDRLGVRIAARVEGRKLVGTFQHLERSPIMVGPFVLTMGAFRPTTAGPAVCEIDLSDAPFLSIGGSISVLVDENRGVRGCGSLQLPAVGSDSAISLPAAVDVSGGLDGPLRMHGQSSGGPDARIVDLEASWRVASDAADPVLALGLWSARVERRIAVGNTVLSWKAVNRGSYIEMPVVARRPRAVLICVSGLDDLDPHEDAADNGSYLQADTGPFLRKMLSEIYGTSNVEVTYFADRPDLGPNAGGYQQLLAKLDDVSSRWCRGALVPPHVVVAAHSHGGVWSHSAVAQYSDRDLPIVYMVDLDTNSFLFESGHGTHSIPRLLRYADVPGADPYAHEIEDFIPAHVNGAFEARLYGLFPLDERTNYRESLSTSVNPDVFFPDSHFSVHHTDGQALPAAAAWVKAWLLGTPETPVATVPVPTAPRWVEDSSGSVVRELSSASTVWDRTDAAGAPVDSGIYHVFVRTVAADGSVRSEESGVVVVDDVPPSITVTRPAADAATPRESADAELRVEGVASDNIRLDRVTWSTDRGEAGSATGTLTWQASIPLHPGANRITVTAFDLAGGAGSATVQYSYVPASIRLTAGFTLVALPSAPRSPLSAAGLLAMINRAGGSATAVIDAQSAVMATRLASGSGPDFAISSGRSYFVLSGGPAQVAIPGDVLPQTGVRLQLNAGMNYLGLPARTSTKRASSIASEIDAQGGRVRAIYRWINGAPVAYLPGRSPNDFEVAEGEGFVVLVDRGSEWEARP